MERLKPGWVLTNVGGVRYDGTHYSFSRRGVIEVYRDSILNYIPYDPLYEEWIRSNITFIIDQRVPPTGWSYKGHIPDPYHPKHVWENALKKVQVYWSRSSVMMSCLASLYLLSSSDTPAGVFRAIRDIPNRELDLTRASDLASRELDREIQSLVLQELSLL